MKRPMEIYENIFKEQKLMYIKKKKSIIVRGKLKPGKYKVRGDISSQFISGLIFALPLLNGNSSIILTTPLQSKEYVNLTIDVIKKYGIKIKRISNGFYIFGNQKYKPIEYFVESDYSAAAFFLVAKEMGAKINLIGLNKKSHQGDKKIVNIINKTKKNKLGVTIDVSNIPDLVPILVVYMSLCLKTSSKIINAKRLRFKESDRLTAIATEINKMGGKIIEGSDYLIINPVKKMHNAALSS
jgi:3-phosphoshikimate 1-carboxyvinyltransferase